MSSMIVAIFAVGLVCSSLLAKEKTVTLDNTAPTPQIVKQDARLDATLVLTNNVGVVTEVEIKSEIRDGLWAEKQIYELKSRNLPVPAELYRLVREYYGLPDFDQPLDRQGGDTIETATEITGLPHSSTGTTIGYTNDYDEVCDYTGSTAPDVVYSYTPTADEIVDITLCNGSDYDTKLYLYENTYIPGSPFACNDDACPGYVSELAGLNLIGGNTYYIVVDGYFASEGNYVLDIFHLIPCEVECPAGAIIDPEPDCYDGYIDSWNSGCLFYPSIHFGYIECGQTICGTAGTYIFEELPTRDMDWFAFEIVEDMTVTWSVEAEFSPYLRLIDQGDCTAPVTIASAYGAECEVTTVSAILTAGQYAVYVSTDVYTGVPGDTPYRGTLTCEPYSLPAGTNCAYPVPVSLPTDLPYTDLNQTNCGMMDDYFYSEMDDYDGGEDIIYELIVTETVTVDITMDPGTTTYSGIAVFNGCPDVGVLLYQATGSAASLRELESIALTAGTYYIMIDTWAPPECITSFDLTITNAYCDVVCPPEHVLEGEETCYDEYVDLYNGGCDVVVPAFTDLQCGTTVCGTAGTFLLNAVETRDTDWYSFTLEEISEVVWTGAAEFNVTMALVSGVPECDPEVILISGSEGSCDVVTLTTTLAAGSYAAFVAPTDFTGVICGSEYYATLTCTPAPPRGDYCINPYLIESLPYYTIGTTADNTDTHGIVSPDEWYQFTLDAPALVTVELCGPDTDYDTYMHLIASDCTTEIAFNDDGPECPESAQNYAPSEISLELEPGTYNVSVEGYSSNFGVYNLDIHIDEPCVVECPPESADEGEVVCFDEYVDATNGGCDAAVPAFTDIECGATVCGTAGTFLLNAVETRDTDWYSFTLLETSDVVWTGAAEFNLTMALVSGVPACDPEVIVISGSEGSCDVVNLTTTLVAGSYAAFIAPTAFTGVVCGSAYYATLTCTPWSPPPGDYCINPYLIESLPYSTTGTTTDNTDTHGNPSPDEWYQFTLENSALVTVELCGPDTDYDTSLRLLGADCETQFGYSNDGPECPESDQAYAPSEISLELEPGSYNVSVEGHSSNFGIYNLDIHIDEPCVVECPPESTDEGEVVCYDEYIDYYNSGCLQFPYFFGAIANGETICGTSGTYLVADVLTRDTDWFRFELTEASEVSVSCEAEFPLYLVIVSVADCSAPIIAEQYGEACEVVTLASLLDAGAYAVFVASDGQGLVTCGTPYRVTLNYTPIVPPVGDSCADPLVAPCLPYQFFSTTANRTDTYGNPAPDEWTRFTLEEASHVVITLCGGGTVYDSYLSLLDADCVTEILYNDDSCDMQSEIAADLEAGTYVICVEGYESNSGEYQLDIIVPEPVVQIQYSEGGAILTISGGEGAAAYNIYRSLLPFDDGEDDPEFLLVDTILNGADDEIWTDYVTGSYFYQVTASCIPE